VRVAVRSRAPVPLRVGDPPAADRQVFLDRVSKRFGTNSGRVEIRGRDVTDLPPNRRDVNTLFQSYALFPHMSVEQNVGYGLRMKRVAREERRARVREALELVGMLSGAQGAGNLIWIGHMGVTARGLHVVVGLAALGRTLADLGASVRVGVPSGVEAR
jgi:ABC-type taurine transport system ATPase subunit